jgi:uncharacterized protein YjbI with pentapeptide repeats
MHLTGVNLIGVNLYRRASLTGIHPISMHLTSINIMSLYITSMHLAGVNLMGVYLIGVHLLQACISLLSGLSRANHRGVIKLGQQI